MAARLQVVQSNVGAVASPFDCWLTLRGLRTLSVRLDRQCDTAMELACFLKTQQQKSISSLVQKVHYPGLKTHPQHDIARQQMAKFGGMLSFEVVGGVDTAMAIAGAVRLIKRATSLGGTETLIEHRASIEPEGRVVSPPGLLRISVGLEDVNDLKHDIGIALEIADKVVGSRRK